MKNMTYVFFLVCRLDLLELNANHFSIPGILFFGSLSMYLSRVSGYRTQPAFWGARRFQNRIDRKKAKMKCASTRQLPVFVGGGPWALTVAASRPIDGASGKGTKRSDIATVTLEQCEHFCSNVCMFFDFVWPVHEALFFAIYVRTSRTSN